MRVLVVCVEDDVDADETLAVGADATPDSGTGRDVEGTEFGAAAAAALPIYGDGE